MRDGRDRNKLREVEWAARWIEEGGHEDPWKPFGLSWGSHYWTKWATIAAAFGALGLEPPASVIDVGCGTGWTSAFLAQAGFTVTGVDLVPSFVEIARSRAARWGLEAEFEVADMDTLALGRTYDGALLFDALHHTRRRADAVANVARHLRPGGWVLFGEPSWLHYLSPHAIRTSRELGWVERGVPLARLKRECERAGLGNFRRFQEGTAPYERGLRSLAWQVTRLVAAHVWVAPQASVWLAAQRR